jgi:hypothetical protein
MALRIEDGKLFGTITVTAQFLYNTGFEPKQYPVKYVFDGADLNIVGKNTVDSLTIKLRKRIKTPAQAEALANGITIYEADSAKAPENPDAKAASLDVNALSPEVFEMLLKKAQDRLAAETENNNS